MQGYIPADVKKSLEAIVKRTEKAADLQKRISRLEDYLRTINEDITRIDSCLGALALSQSSLYAYLLPPSRLNPTWLTHVHVNIM
jgi:hypothetical protein